MKIYIDLCQSFSTEYNNHDVAVTVGLAVAVLQQCNPTVTGECVSVDA